MSMSNEQLLMYFATLEISIFLFGFVMVYLQQRKQTALIEDFILNPDYASEIAKNLVFGFMQEIADDEKKQAAFFTFVSITIQNALIGLQEGVKTTATKRGIKIPKIETPMDLINFAVNIPAVQGKIEQGIERLLSSKENKNGGSSDAPRNLGGF